MPRINKNIVLTPLEMCRICLSDNRQEYIDVMGPNEPHLLQHVKDYYKVEILGNDGKSTNLCQNCVEYIDIWQGHIEKAKESQMIVNYLAEKRYTLTSTSQAIKRSSSVANKRKKTTRRLKRRKRSSSISEFEIPSTSTSASNYLHFPMGTPLPLQYPSTSTSTSTSTGMIPFASTSASNYLNFPRSPPLPLNIPSTSTSTEMIPFASTSAEYIPFASTSAEVIPVASTSAEVIPFASTSAEIIPVASTSAETIPFASTSKEIIPVASTSTEIIPVASTSAEINPFTASTSAEVIPVASTSAEVIPFASTSTEIIPIASTSTEIVPSYTINEISSAGNNQVWYSNGIEITNPELEVFAELKCFKAEYVCIFCTYQHEEVSRNAYKHIVFCAKHSKPHACLIENCHSVFPNKAVFIPHYRTHLNLNSSTCLCHQCFGVLTCSRRSMACHTHQNTSDLFKCCSLTFTTMTKLVLHKLINHCAIVVTSNNRSRTLQKQNLNIKVTELGDIKVGLDIPGIVPSNQIIKDNGSFKCYCCPKYFDNVLEFIEHTKIKHKNLITLKDKGIQLCPLCDHSYFNEQFSEHIENCTNTLKVGNRSSNNYGCVHCSTIFTDVSPREIRNHVLYCKSFKLGIVNNKLHHKCINCTFTSTDDKLSLLHANSNCIYLKLKMRYAMGPDEKIKVMQRMEFIKQNTEKQKNKDSTSDEELLSSYTVCNTARQKLLKFYNYYCNYCENLFFDKTTFFKHLTETGSHCRLQTLIYCQKCLTEFNTLEEYQGHLPSMPEASPILSIKEERFGQNNDEYDNLSTDLLCFTPNYYGVKVEMKNETFYQKQEPYDETTDMQYQEQELEPEQETEFSNNDLNNGFSCSEMEDDIYMQCEVEEKPDLEQLLLDNDE